MMQDVHVKINAELPWGKKSFNKKKGETSKLLWNGALYCAGNWKRRKVDQKYLERY
jgi:hypothetical protein